MSDHARSRGSPYRVLTCATGWASQLAACVCIEPAQPRNGRPTGTHSTRQSVLTPKRLPPLCVCRAGDAAAARERTVLPDAMQWLWIWCRPVGYRQHGLGRQLSPAGAQSPLLCAPTSTGMACVCIEPARLRNGRPTGTHSTRQSVLPPKAEGGCRVCDAGAAAAARESGRCSQIQCSGSGFDVGRSSIASTDSDGS